MQLFNNPATLIISLSISKINQLCLAGKTYRFEKAKINALPGHDFILAITHSHMKLTFIGIRT